MSTLKKTALIIYFVVVVVGSIAGMFSYGARMWEWIDLLVSIPTIVAFWGFLSNKKFFSAIFWRVYCVLFIAWELIYFYILPMPLRVLSQYESIGVSQYVPATLVVLFYLPLFVVLYLYAFKGFDTYRVEYKGVDSQK